MVLMKPNFIDSRKMSESGGRPRRHDDPRPGEKRLRRSPIARSRGGARVLRYQELLTIKMQ